MERKSSIVAKRLAELREGVKLSQAKLAAEFEGVDQPAYPFRLIKFLCNNQPNKPRFL